MNVECINSNDKTNFKSKMAFSTEISPQNLEKLFNLGNGFENMTKSLKTDVFIPSVSEEGNIQSISLGAFVPDRNNIFVKVYNLTLSKPLNINDSKFLPNLLERYNDAKAAYTVKDRALKINGGAYYGIIPFN